MKRTLKFATIVVISILLVYVAVARQERNPAANPQKLDAPVAAQPPDPGIKTPELVSRAAGQATNPATNLSLRRSDSSAATQASNPMANPRRIDSPAVSYDSEFRMGPEDVIEVFVWKEPELSTSVTVRPDGKISLPLTSEIVASGKTAPQLQQEIRERLTRYVADPTVTVIVKQVNSAKISVLGEVRRPDVYKIMQRITVLDAIAMAGGFTEYAKPDRVTVIRNGPEHQRIKFNLKQYIKDGRGELFYLQPFDVVYVQ